MDRGSFARAACWEDRNPLSTPARMRHSEKMASAPASKYGFPLSSIETHTVLGCPEGLEVALDCLAQEHQRLLCLLGRSLFSLVIAEW